MNIFKVVFKECEIGFSLTEVVTVISILGFLLAVAVPVWSTYVSNSNLSAAVRQVATDIRAAQSEASAELKFCGIDFKENGSGYSIYSSSTTSGSGLFVSANHDRSETLPGGITFSGNGGNPITFFIQAHGENRVIFQKSGSANSGSVYLSKDQGTTARQMTVVATGKVTIK